MLHVLVLNQLVENVSEHVGSIDINLAHVEQNGVHNKIIAFLNRHVQWRIHNDLYLLFLSARDFVHFIF